MRNEYTNLVEKEKEKYLSSLGLAISDPNSGPKKYWAAMRKILKKKNDFCHSSHFAQWNFHNGYQGKMQNL